MSAVVWRRHRLLLSSAVAAGVLFSFYQVRDQAFFSKRAQKRAADFPWMSATLETTTAGSLQMERPLPNNIMSASDRELRYKTCRKVFDFDCMKIIAGNANETAKAVTWQVPSDWLITPADVVEKSMVSGCSHLLERIGLIMQPLTPHEANSSIAFVMLIHSNFDSFLRVLRQVYRPQNAFAIHVDAKSKPAFRMGVETLADCLPNVAIVSPSLDINWGAPSILAALLEGLKRLVAMPETEYPWNYVQFLSETDGSIRTNGEMIEIFRIFGGANDVELTHDEFNRFMTITTFKNNLSEFFDFHQFAPRHKQILPGNLRPFKGRSASTLSRAFVQFLLTNPVAKEFYEWTQNTWISAEKFFATLNHNLHLDPPGGYPGVCVDYYSKPYFDTKYLRKPFVSRFQTWQNNSMGDGLDQCAGEWVRWSCAFGVGDLPAIVKQPHLIAHKFEADVQPAAAYCLEEWLCRRTFADAGQQDRDWQLNKTFYENLPAVKYHMMKDKSRFVCHD